MFVFLIWPSQDSEPRYSHKINCPERYPTKQSSRTVPFRGIFEISTLKTIQDPNKNIQKDLQPHHTVHLEY